MAKNTRLLNFLRRGRIKMLMFFLVIAALYVLIIALSYLRFSSSYFQLFTLAVTSLFFFLLAGEMKKSYRGLVTPALMLFVVLSALSYIIPVVFKTPLYYTGNTLFVIMLISPEIFAFIGLLITHKRIRILRYALFIIAIVLVVDIVPPRMTYVFDATPEWLMMLSEQNNVMPFGKEDREHEFSRSFEIIENLSVKSAETQSDNLQNIVIYLPNLAKYPDILKIDTLDDAILRAQWLDMRWPNIEPVFRRKEYLLDVRFDSDGDGLSDFKEAEMLSDAYAVDTDGDGIHDNDDTDPLNDLIVTDYAEIKALVLNELSGVSDSGIVYLVDNGFYNGHGEFANCGKHIVILHPDQINKWNIIFGEQYTEGLQRSLFGQRLCFGNNALSISRHIAVVGVIEYHGVWADSSGLIFFLFKWGGNWRIISGRCIWI